jgi:hypothetical protein
MRSGLRAAPYQLVDSWQGYSLDPFVRTSPPQPQALLSQARGLGSRERAS